jgi:hypothetical protein
MIKERRSTTYDNVLEVLGATNPTYLAFVEYLDKNVTTSFKQKVNSEYIDRVCYIKHSEIGSEEEALRLYDEMRFGFSIVYIETNLLTLNISIEQITQENPNPQDLTLANIGKLTDDDKMEIFRLIILAIAEHNC